MKKKIKMLFRNKSFVKLFAGVLALLILLTIYICVNSAKSNRNDADEGISAKTSDSANDQKHNEETDENLHIIEGVPTIKQDYYTAACETYACTMLLQGLGYDMDEHMFVENYLITKPVYYDGNGTMYGPDLDCAFAGSLTGGYGMNAPAMAKCMNNYLSTTDTGQQAYLLKGVDLDDLCEQYIANDIPVMVWATTFMDEPYVRAYWVIDYVDENADSEIGDTEQWQQGEHCMVLIGYDEENYYFADSVAGEVSVYDKETSKDRYEKIGSQAIVVK